MGPMAYSLHGITASISEVPIFNLYLVNAGKRTDSILEYRNTRMTGKRYLDHHPTFCPPNNEEYPELEQSGPEHITMTVN